MKKTKKFQSLDSFDYWMGLAFLLAAKSPNQYAAVIVQNNCIVSIGVSTTPSMCEISDCFIPAETIAIMNSQKEFVNATIILTKTPDYNCAMSILAVTGLRKILYYSTETLDERVQALFSGFFGEIDEYKGNLNWIYDYINSLDL